MTKEQVANYEDFIDEVVDELGDESEAQSGYTQRLIPEGIGLCRLIEYIELGEHFGTYNGKPKDKANEFVRLGFEFSGKNFPAEEIEVDGVKKKIPHVMRIEVSKTLTEKSKYFKLFKLLNWEQKAKHMAQLAARNVAAKVRVVHNSKGEGKDKKTYANIYTDGAWTLAAPFKMDEESGESTLINVAPAISPTKIFLFNKPRLQDWAQLFIDGTRDDGTSKNWIQAKIREAVNFKGSPLEALLAGAELGEEPAPKAEKKESRPDSKPAQKKQKGDDLGDI